MPITREAFQIKNPGDEGDLVEGLADVLDGDRGASIVDPPSIVDSENAEPAEGSKDEPASRNAADAGAEEGPQLARKEASNSLPAADTTSAEKREAVGAAYPERETRRSVASGRDVPQFTTRSQGRERMEFNWDEARAQTEVYERQARAQRDAATKHLARIHDVVGLLIEMSEAHSNDARTKLQSLESKVAELESRFSVNRFSP